MPVERLREELGHLTLGLVDGGRDDVRRLLVGELDDVLAQVGLDGVTPAPSRASLRSISSVAMDLDFTAILTPRSRQSRSTISRASSAVAAQCTCPPSRCTLSASCPR